MVDTLPYPRELIAERVVFTPADHAQIALCRGVHNRLGFAYQMAFLRLTGRFPNQQPLELLPDVLAFVASELALALPVIDAYAQRQATVSAHQEQIRLHLGFRSFDLGERETLSQFLREEALHLDHLAKPGQDIRYLSTEITGSYPAETSSKSHSCCAETGKRA